jgi:hypothetical protein
VIGPLSEAVITIERYRTLAACYLLRYKTTPSRQIYRACDSIAMLFIS